MADNDLYSMRQKLLIMQNELIKNAENVNAKPSPQQENPTPAGNPSTEQETALDVLKDIRENQNRIIEILEKLAVRLLR